MEFAQPVTVRSRANAAKTAAFNHGSYPNSSLRRCLMQQHALPQFVPPAGLTNFEDTPGPRAPWDEFMVMAMSYQHLLLQEMKSCPRL